MKKNHNAIIVPEAAGAISPYIEQLNQRAKETERAFRAKNTLRAYNGQWALFLGWCEDQSAFVKWASTCLAKGMPTKPAPTDAVRLYLQACADGYDDRKPLKASSLSIARAAIRWVHVQAGLPLPTLDAKVARTWEGLLRTKGVKPNRKKPILDEELKTMVDVCDDSLVGLRDRALLLVGRTTACRRSELVAMHIEHLNNAAAGLVLQIPRSKGDQRAEGQQVIIPRSKNRTYCPVIALGEWLSASEIREGPIWRRILWNGEVSKEPRALTDQVVRTIVRKYLRIAGYDPSEYSAHSLRAGFVTAATLKKQSVPAIMQQTRHVKSDTVQIYVRYANPFDGNAASEMTDI